MKIVKILLFIGLIGVCENKFLRADPAMNPLLGNQQTKELPFESSSEDEDIENIEQAQWEMREQSWEGHQQGLALSFGESSPWQSSSAHMGYWFIPHLYGEMILGKGRWSYQGSFDTATPNSAGSRHFGYEVFLETWSLAAAARYHPSYTLPITLGGGLTYTSYTGLLTLRGVEDQASSSSGNTQDIQDIGLDTAFRAHGPSVYLTAGLNHQWENGLYIDYTLVGVSYGWLWGMSTSQPTSRGENLLESLIQEGRVWGFLNLTLGIYL